jgi:hypothetical protein
MHSLDVIILKNARAAGREAAHAHNDGSTTLDQAVMLAASDVVRGCYYMLAADDVVHRCYCAQAEERDRFGNAVSRAFSDGWNAGKLEG